MLSVICNIIIHLSDLIGKAKITLYNTQNIFPIIILLKLSAVTVLQIKIIFLMITILLYQFHEALNYYWAKFQFNKFFFT